MLVDKLFVMNYDKQKQINSSFSVMTVRQGIFEIDGILAMLSSWCIVLYCIVFEVIVEIVLKCLKFCFVLYFSYDIEQEQKLAVETTVLVEQYTVSSFEPTSNCSTIFISLMKFTLMCELKISIWLNQKSIAHIL